MKKLNLHQEVNLRPYFTVKMALLHVFILAVVGDVVFLFLSIIGPKPSDPSSTSLLPFAISFGAALVLGIWKKSLTLPLLFLVLMVGIAILVSYLIFGGFIISLFFVKWD